jgi:hypothetical protein
MTQTVVHQPRLAWDGARALVRASYGAHYEMFAAQVFRHLGPTFHAELGRTRERVLTALVDTGGDRYVSDVETARWRVRLEDLLRTRPDRAGAVQDLIRQAG